MVEQVIDNSTVEPVAQDTGTQSSSPAEVAQKGTETSGQQPAQTAPKPSYDPEWWKKDDRFTKRKLWKAEPDIIKSYYELEPQYNKVKGDYTTLQKQNADIVSAFKEYGIEPSAEQIKGVLTELKTFKDPLNPTNARAAYLSKWIDHKDSNFQSKFVQFMENLEREEMQANFPGWTEQQIAEHKKMQAELEELRTEREKQQLERDTQVSTQKLNEGLGQAKTYADKVGFQLTDEVKNGLIDYCMKHDVPTTYIFETFLKLNGEGIEKALIAKSQQEQLKNLNKTKSAVIPSAGSSKPKQVKDSSWRDKALAALKGA